MQRGARGCRLHRAARAHGVRERLPNVSRALARPCAKFLHAIALRRRVDRDGRLAMGDGDGRKGGRRCVRCDAWVPPAGRGGGRGRGRDAALHLHLHLQLHQRSLAPGSGLWQQIPAKVGQALDTSALARESKAKTKLTPTSTQHLFSFLQRLKPPQPDCTVPSTVRQQSCLSERSTATA